MTKLNNKLYFNRLKNASIAELVYRARQFFFIRQLRRLLKNNKKPVQIPSINPEDIKRLELPIFGSKINKGIIEQIFAGKVFSFNSDPSVLKEFEKKYSNVYFADIKYTDASPDIRAVWEPARLQHLTTLLSYSILNPQSFDCKKAKQYTKDFVFEWAGNNPVFFGPHYKSAMECGLRVPVFFYCLKLIDTLTGREHELILEVIYQHAWWISKRLSLYSSLGNHTIAECVGLVFAGAIFSKTKTGKQWLDTGIKILNRELNHQILEDGGPAEQSLNYHRFVLDLYWLAINFLERNKIYDCRDMKEILVRGEDFLSNFTNISGAILPIGDSDDGFAVAPGIYPERHKSENIKKECRHFFVSGYTVIATENNSMLTFDHGPLGMPPLYNHGHADALSVTLSKDGLQLLVDPGTYRYNGVPHFRRYFKGTRAHNTVVVDGLDQAVQETGFIWSKPFGVKAVECSKPKENLLFGATHNGYARLKKPVWHKRMILFSDRNIFIIKDSFHGSGIHSFELNYHLHPDAVVRESDGWWHIKRESANIFLKLFGKNNFQFIKGQKEPLLGWYSPSYGTKIESSVLNCTKQGPCNEINFITVICTDSLIGETYLKDKLLTI